MTSKSNNGERMSRSVVEQCVVRLMWRKDANIMHGTEKKNFQSGKCHSCWYMCVTCDAKHTSQPQIETCSHHCSTLKSMVSKQSLSWLLHHRRRIWLLFNGFGFGFAFVLFIIYYLLFIICRNKRIIWNWYVWVYL